MKKVVILHNIITPARIFIFNEISEYLKLQGYQLKVLFFSKSDKNREWDTNTKMNLSFKIMENLALRLGGKDLFTFFINPSIIYELDKVNPDIIICFGWDHLSAYMANYWSRRKKKKFILWSGSTKYEKSWRRLLFKPLVKFLINRTDSFIAYGARSKLYLESLGAKKNRIDIFYNTIDIDNFRKQIDNITSYQKKKLRSAIGITTNKVMTYIGQLICRKGIYDLLRGFHLYYRHDPDASLLLIGSGREKNKLMNLIKKLHINNVFFVDFIQYQDIYKYYAISDVLLLPSHEEVWGLVINEAMACGLPVITTDVTGASIDLVDDGKNGYVIHPRCPKCICDAMIMIYEHKLNTSNISAEIIMKTHINNNLHVLKKYEI